MHLVAELRRYIDSTYDLVNAKIDAAIPYQGPKESYLRL